MDLLSPDFEDEVNKIEGERQRVLYLQQQGRQRPTNHQQHSTAAGQGIRQHDDRTSLGTGGGGGKHIVCRHWLRNMCIKGDFCDFTHQYDFDKMPICRQYHKVGYCADYAYGACPLKHIEPLTGAITNNSSAPPTGTLEPACLHYFLGFCRSGPRCRKRHVQLESSLAPQLLPDWYLQLVVSNRGIISQPDAQTERHIAMVEQHFKQMCNEDPTSNHHRQRSNNKQQDSDRSAAPSGSASQLGNSNIPSPTTGRLARSRSTSSYFSTNTDSNASAARSSMSTHHTNSTAVDASSYTGTEKCNGDGDLNWSADDFGIEIPGPVPAEGRVRCFTIKSLRMDNIYTSVQLGIWATGKVNTRKFEEAYYSNDHVLLLFSANESGGFQGLGRMSSPPDMRLHAGVWGDISSRLGSNFSVQWLKQCTADFDQLGHFTNPLNDNHVIKKSRDGQEIPFSLARAICRKLSLCADQDLLFGTPVEGQSRIDHKTFFISASANNTTANQQPPNFNANMTADVQLPDSLQNGNMMSPNVTNSTAVPPPTPLPTAGTVIAPAGLLSQQQQAVCTTNNNNMQQRHSPHLAGLGSAAGADSHTTPHSRHHHAAPPHHKNVAVPPQPPPDDNNSTPLGTGGTLAMTNNNINLQPRFLAPYGMPVAGSMLAPPPPAMNGLRVPPSPPITAVHNGNRGVDMNMMNPMMMSNNGPQMGSGLQQYHRHPAAVVDYSNHESQLMRRSTTSPNILQHHHNTIPPPSHLHQQQSPHRITAGGHAMTSSTSPPNNYHIQNPDYHLTIASSPAKVDSTIMTDHQRAPAKRQHSSVNTINSLQMISNTNGEVNGHSNEHYQSGAKNNSRGVTDDRHHSTKMSAHTYPCSAGGYSTDGFSKGSATRRRLSSLSSGIRNGLDNNMRAEAGNRSTWMDS
eukprot:Lankesteria_metandrocarpae@DN497_c0_g1_i1.p1